MGFYSFYKILKDMIRTLFGKNFLKILIIIILIIGVIFVYNECFALSTIPPITVDNVTFTFSSGWNNDNNSFTGDMDKTTILRYNAGSNYYYYYFVRSSYPIYITSSVSGSYNIHSIHSYNNNNASYFYSNGTRQSTNTTNISVSNPSTRNTDTISSQYLSINISSLTVLYSDTDIYLNNEPIYSNFTPPSLGNTQTQLENLSFDNFIINANSFTQDMIADPDQPLVMLFYNRSLGNSSNTDGLYPIKEKYFYKESIYFDSTNSTDTNYIFNYPIFRSGVFFNIGSTYEIKLAKRVYIEEYDTWGYDYFDNSYVFTVSNNVTQDYINQLNQQTATSTDEDNQQQLNNALNEQTNAINNQTHSIDNINNSITDSTVDNTSIDLPTDSTNDPTQSGVDNIFQTIYNSFTSGTPQNIVFPIPFSNNNIVIEPNYVSNMLGSTQRGECYNISYSSILLVLDQSIHYNRHHAKNKENKTRQF